MTRAISSKFMPLLALVSTGLFIPLSHAQDGERDNVPPEASATTSKEAAGSLPASEPNIVGKSLPSVSALNAADLYQSVKTSVVAIRTELSLGAGFLVKNRRLIATAYHVIEDGTAISITSKTGNVYEAEIYAFDKANDLAVLELDRNFEDGSPLPLRLLDRLGVGEQVAMVGHPFGDYAESDDDLEGLLTWTITSGIVGAISNRFIQTDAASSPGNSGGPILDMHGRVLGVVSRRLDGAEGLTFSVPVVHLKSLLDSPGDPSDFDKGPAFVEGLFLTVIRFAPEQQRFGFQSSVTRVPSGLGVLWKWSIGGHLRTQVPEESSLYSYQQYSLWGQIEAGPSLWSRYGFGSIDPTLGFRIGYEKTDAVSLYAVPSESNCSGDDCYWDVLVDDTGSDSGWVPMATIGLTYNGAGGSTLGIGALYSLGGEKRLLPSTWVGVQW